MIRAVRFKVDPNSGKGCDGSPPLMRSTPSNMPRPRTSPRTPRCRIHFLPFAKTLLNTSRELHDLTDLLFDQTRKRGYENRRRAKNSWRSGRPQMANAVPDRYDRPTRRPPAWERERRSPGEESVQLGYMLLVARYGIGGGRRPPRRNRCRNSASSPTDQPAASAAFAKFLAIRR